MTLTTKTSDQLEAMIGEAKEAETTAKAALHRNGQPLYTADELQRLTQEAEKARRDTWAVVKAEINRRIDEITPQLAPVDIDPLTSLSATDLQKASSLLPFIREDAERATTPAAIEAFVKKMRLRRRCICGTPATGCTTRHLRTGWMSLRW